MPYRELPLLTRGLLTHTLQITGLKPWCWQIAMPIDSLSVWERVGERALVSNPAHAKPLLPSPSPTGRRETIRTNDFTRRLSFCSNQLFGLNRSQRFD